MTYSEQNIAQTTKSTLTCFIVSKSHCSDSPCVFTFAANSTYNIEQELLELVGVSLKVHRDSARLTCEPLFGGKEPHVKKPIALLCI